ncbi:MAG: thiamine-phosphate synthase family protein [Nitrososphaeria archaeon]
MFTFCEVVAEELLPPLRALIAHKLKEKGYSQTHISALLGKTQPLISHYLDNDIRYWKDKLEQFGFDAEILESYVRTIINDISSDPTSVVKTFNLILKDILKSGKICYVHRRKFPLLNNCNVCIELFSQQKLELNKERENLLKSLEKAIKEIEESPYFSSLVPEVYVNIAASLDICNSFEDIATIPGRIVKVKNRVKALMPPEFGVVSHLTKLLLEVKKIDSSTNVVINIKYDKKLARIVSESKISFTKTEHKIIYNEDDIINYIRRAIIKFGAIPQIVFDEGGFGLEPMTYVFGKSIEEVVELVLNLAKMYVLK